MAQTINVSQLAAEVMKELGIYSDEVKRALDESIPKIAKEGVKELKSTSPRGGGRRHYADGWAVKTENGRLGVESIIYNKTKPGLAHLLEKGHAKRSGGRTEGKPHIKPVEDSLDKKIEAEIMRKLM